jgi:sulfur-oxidizing protein SoxY
MDLMRRSLLRGIGSGGVLVAAMAAGLLKPTGVWAADEWNRNAFDAKDTTAALKNIGVGASAESKDLLLKVPEIAENGAVVPIEVVSNLPNTISLAVLVDKNPLPLSAAFDFANGALPEMSVRLKFAQTSNVRAVAKTADGKYYTAQKEIKVTLGGCGG